MAVIERICQGPPVLRAPAVARLLTRAPARRWALDQAVKARYAPGCSTRYLAQPLPLSRPPVSRALRTPSCPERAQPPRERLLDSVLARMTTPRLVCQYDRCRAMSNEIHRRIDVLMKPPIAFLVDIVGESCYSAAGLKAKIW